MAEYLQAFVLGNQAILTNVCLLPLYPGLVAFLAGTGQAAGPQRNGRALLGVVVLAGILTMMLLVGLLLYLANQSFGSVLPVLLPVVYVVVIVFGVLMLAGFNPFNRLSTLNLPMLSNSYATAYLYGLLLGPMTLPCTGPLITTAFLLGANDAALLADGLLYFLFFGLGFGWPLVLLPLLAQPVQRRFTGWLTRNYTLLTRFSGLLLVAIGIYGFAVEVLPNA
jgi:cytochrome c biogenesis protein CcdA